LSRSSRNGASRRDGRPKRRNAASSALPPSSPDERTCVRSGGARSCAPRRMSTLVAILRGSLRSRLRMTSVGRRRSTSIFLAHADHCSR
jgi:hypothetical protein